MSLLALSLFCLIFGSRPCCRRSKAPPTATIGPAPVRDRASTSQLSFPRWTELRLFGGVAFDYRRNRRRKNGCLPGTNAKSRATAESSGAVNVIFPVHDRFESRFDPRTFCSLSIFKHSEEGSHKRETSIQFDYAHKKSTLDEKNLKTGETKHVENDLAGCATDVITGFYYLQSLPLQPGASYEFPISDGKTTIVHATVEKREQIKVPAGTFPTVLVTAEATSGPLQSKGKVWVWYSEDASHTPVQMRAKLGWGTLLFRLLEDREVKPSSAPPPPAWPSPVPDGLNSTLHNF